MIEVSNFPNAYKEVYTILKYVDEDDLKLIPQDFKDTIKARMNKEYEFEYDVNSSFNDKGIIRETKAIFSYVFLNYWANEEQKRAINAQYRKDLEKAEQEKREIYNPNNIFKNKEEKEESIQNKQIVQETAMVEYKEDIITRIKNWFKVLFRR